MDEDALKRPGCNDCNMSWYRDFSMYFHGFRSLPVWIDSIAHSGNLLGSKKA
jgi:hypothetical protein